MRWRHHKLGEFAIACSESFWGFFPYSLNKKKNVTLVLLFYLATCLLVLNVTTYLTIHCKKPTTYINIAFKNVWDCATPNNNLIWKCVKIYYHTLIQFCECDLERKWNLLVVVCNVATKKMKLQYIWALDLIIQKNVLPFFIIMAKQRHLWVVDGTIRFFRRKLWCIPPRPTFTILLPPSHDHLTHTHTLLLLLWLQFYLSSVVPKLSTTYKIVVFFLTFSNFFFLLLSRLWSWI